MIRNRIAMRFPRIGEKLHHSALVKQLPELVLSVLVLLKIGIPSECLASTAKLQKYKIQSSRSGLFGFFDMIEVHFREREVHIYAQKNHPEKPCI